VKTQATTQGIGTVGRARSVALLSLALGTALSAVVALAGVAHQADAASPEKIVFASERTTGKGVDNPTGDAEIFRMNPNGTGVRQLTFNQAIDTRPLLSPDGQKILYRSQGSQTSNPQGDQGVYVVNASDGSGQKNLTNNALVADQNPYFSPDGQKIAYTSQGEQASNPEGDPEIYRVNTLDGLGKKNLTNNKVAYDGYYLPGQS
jgi:Tol biopolymer transport system component